MDIDLDAVLIDRREIERLRASNAELLALLAHLIDASDRQVSALLRIEDARAAIARAKEQS